jgi:hypothetical protein
MASLDPIGLALAESPVAVAEAPERQLAAL